MTPADPAHPLHPANIRREWSRLLAGPKGLARPLVVLTGWRAPWWAATLLATRLQRLTGAHSSMVVPLWFTWRGGFDPMVEHVLRSVQARWPSPDPGRTTEVDVIGVSMGGLVARAAATPAAAERFGRRLSIRRLFTLGTPHRGAKIARYIALDAAARCMRAGSDWLCTLDEDLPRREYELVCYTRLRDMWVGARNTAPAGMEPIWLSPPIFGSHILITLDRRILIDIARRLREEDPLLEPGEPPPTD